jgi:hypothetical protein
MNTAWRVAARLQVFDGVLRPPVLDQQIQGVTDEKRVVRVGIADIRVLLQAKLQGSALLPEGIGPEDIGKRPAKRRQGRSGERCQCARGADLGDQRHGGAAGCRASRPAAARFGCERRDVGMKSGDLAQQIRRLDRVRSLAAEDV